MCEEMECLRFSVIFSGFELQMQMEEAPRLSRWEHRYRSLGSRCSGSLLGPIKVKPWQNDRPDRSHIAYTHSHSVYPAHGTSWFAVAGDNTE